METIKEEYIVVAQSSNTNSFGLTQMIVVNRRGEAYKTHCNSLNKRPEGDVIISHTTIEEKRDIKSVSFVGGELTSKIVDCPMDVTNEIWKDYDNKL